MIYLNEALKKGPKTVKSLFVWDSNDDIHLHISKFTALTEIGLGMPLDNPLLKGLSELPSLEKIIIYSDYLPDKVPEWLKKIPQLKSLQCFERKNIKAIPDWVFELTQLEQLSFYGHKLTLLPEAIGQLKKLKVLELHQNKITNLPNTLFELKNLEVLTLSKNKVKVLPEAIGNLKKLKTLDIAKIPLSSLPKSLGTLVELETFTWEDIKVDNQLEVAKILFQLPKLDAKVCRADTRKLLRLTEAARVVNPSGEMLSDFLALFEEKASAYADISLKTLVHATMLKGTSVPELALKIIWERHKKKFQSKPLQKGDKVSMLGKTNLKKNEIKADLEALGLEYEPSPTASTTHIVLGPQGSIEAEFFELIDSHEFIFIAEEDLLKFINEATQAHLLQDGVAMTAQKQSVAELLMSKDADNVGIGLELLKGGGVPKDLISELFIVYKYKTHKKNSKKALELLKLYGSSALQDALKNKVRKLSARSTDNLYIFTEGTELEQWKINQYICLYVDDFMMGMNQHNLIGDAVELAPKELQLPFLKKLIQKWGSSDTGQFIWRQELDFSKYGYLTFELNHITRIIVSYVYWSKIQPSSFPKGITKMKNLKSINLSYNLAKLGGIPEDLFELKDQLTELELPECSLESISPRIGELQQLELLNLSNNPLKSLPKEIYTLKNLKTIKLRYMEKQLPNLDLEGLQKALPNCKIIT